jgi:hypothetical protein
MVFDTVLESFHSFEIGQPQQIPEGAIVILCHAEWANKANKGQVLSFGQRKRLFETCNESHVMNRSDNTRCDPMLPLYTGVRLMHNYNKSVASGIANGTFVVLEEVLLKGDAILKPIKYNGYWVNSVNVEEVDHLRLRWESDNERFDGTFCVRAISKKFSVRYRPAALGKKRTMKDEVPMKLTQFPVVVNHATTGHKLQGKSVEALYVAEYHKTKNWLYVVMSRVRSITGLFLFKAIPSDIDTKPAPEYLSMMERFRKTILVTE